VTDTPAEVKPLPERLRVMAEVVMRNELAGATTRRLIQLDMLEAADLIQQLERQLAEAREERTRIAEAVRFAPDSAHWSAELAKLLGEDSLAGISTLRKWLAEESGRRHAAEAQLAAQRERDGRDAARYRWLRQGDNDEPCLRDGNGKPFDDSEHYFFLLRNDELDAAIDAALKDRP
jgi:hypothetical protein